MPIARVLLALFLLSLAALAPAAPRVGVMTMQPGEIFFERFGHNAIVVQDTATGAATSYNFGYFDPGEANFAGNFAKGVMQYYLVALPIDQDLSQYQQAGRGVDIQWLDLRPDQAQQVSDALQVRAQPENARYRYDYFKSNCATEVRDVINKALAGGLAPQLQGRSRGNTYRSESVRLASPATWMWLGFDLGLGPQADRPLSRWEEAFVPMRLADSLREAKNSDGRPLVQSEQNILPHRIAAEPAEAPRRWWPWLLAGMAIAIALVTFSRRRPRFAAALALPFWLACGLAGAVLTYLWAGTDHWAAWRNHNLLVLNPLCLALAAGAIGVLRRRTSAPWFRWLLWLTAGCALFAWFVQWLPFAFGYQYNQTWIALLLPIHLALAYVFTRTRTPS